MSVIKKIKNFLFTKKSKPAPIVNDPVPEPVQTLDTSSFEDLLEDITVPSPKEDIVDTQVVDTWDPYKENHREEASVHTDIAPKSISGGAMAWLRSSILFRWYSEKKMVVETGLTTRQRIKRYNAMYEGKVDPRFPKEGDGGKSDGQRKACT